MHFLNSRSSFPIAYDTVEDIQSQEASTDNSNSSKNSPAPSPHLQSKFYRFQAITDKEPPETFYENEAWAPKDESIRVFHKHRINFE